MYTTTTYIGTLDNINGMWCGFLPEDKNIIVKEERLVLHSDEGKVLRNINTDEIVGSSIWITDNDSINNYEEVEENNSNIE